MQKALSIFFGLGLISLGLLALAGTLFLPLIGFSFRFWELWRFWPITVLALGLLLAAIPLLSPGQRALGVLFILAFPILTNGAILFFASIFDVWGAWTFLWPLEVLSVAVGFLFASLFTRSIWLGIPTILIGLNGLVLAFCNTTGLWNWWAVLWAVEPLALGLSFLLISAKYRSAVLLALGLLFCGFASLAALGMSAIIFSSEWLFRIAWPMAFILLGGVLLALSLFRQPSATRTITPNNGA
jgi:hypothetical protein